MNLRIQLERSERHVSEGAHLIARQAELIQQLIEHGVEVDRYQRLLADFQEAQRTHVERKDQLQKELDERLADLKDEQRSADRGARG